MLANFLHMQTSWFAKTRMRMEVFADSISIENLVWDAMYISDNEPFLVLVKNARGYLAKKTSVLS